jgi:hypothetical protein
MVHVTRRTFIEGTVALPATAAYASANDARSERESERRVVLQPSTSFRIFLGGHTAVHEDMLLLRALQMFPSALQSFEVQSRMSSSAALWALAAHGNGLVCAPCREFVNAALDGLPLVSVAQLSAGPDRSVMVSDSDDAMLNDLCGALLLVCNETDRQRWDALARTQGWRGYTFAAAGGAPENEIACGAARAALVSACERAVIEKRRAPVRFIDLPGMQRMPSVCVATHLSSVANPESSQAIRLVLNALVAADAMDRAMDARSAGATVSSDDPAEIIWRDGVASTTRHRPVQTSRRPWLPRRFGVHDSLAWRRLLLHARALRGNARAPSNPIWVNSYLASGLSRRIAVLGRFNIGGSGDGWPSAGLHA